MNHWCRECGVEITDGDICNECDPVNGSSHMVYTFVGVMSDEQEASQGEQSGESRAWWQFWK